MIQGILKLFKTEERAQARFFKIHGNQEELWKLPANVNIDQDKVDMFEPIVMVQLDLDDLSSGERVINLHQHTSFVIDELDIKLFQEAKQGLHPTVALDFIFKVLISGDQFSNKVLKEILIGELNNGDLVGVEEIPSNNKVKIFKTVPIGLLQAAEKAIYSDEFETASKDSPMWDFWVRLFNAGAEWNKKQNDEELIKKFDEQNLDNKNDERLYSKEDMIQAILSERKRCIQIAYDFHEAHEQSYKSQKKAGNELAFIEEKIADECRVLGNTMSGLTALSDAVGESMEDVVRRDFEAK